MKQSFELKFLNQISKKVKVNRDTKVILIAHFIKDMLELLEVLNKLVSIEIAIAIPYSIDSKLLEQFKSKYEVITPNLNVLMDSKQLLSLLKPKLNTDCKYILWEVGGYCAPIINELNAYLNGNLIGVIEDTEAGHRRYKAIASESTVPIISIARSILKQKEDFIVGQCCVSSFLRLFDNNFQNELANKKFLILGYGKIGRSVAYALRKRGYKYIGVYDCDPFQRLQANIEEFATLEKENALSEADFIFGATGNSSLSKEDYTHIKNECYLISCSSKDCEFDIEALKKNYICSVINENVEKLNNSKKSLYLVAKGRPVNFIDPPLLVGKIIVVVYAEVLFAFEYINNKNLKGLIEIPNEKKAFIAEEYLQAIRDIDNNTG